MRIHDLDADHRLRAALGRSELTHAIRHDGRQPVGEVALHPDWPVVLHPVHGGIRLSVRAPSLPLSARDALALTATWQVGRVWTRGAETRLEITVPDGGPLGPALHHLLVSARGLKENRTPRFRPRPGTGDPVSSWALGPLGYAAGVHLRCTRPSLSTAMAWLRSCPSGFIRPVPDGIAWSDTVPIAWCPHPDALVQRHSAAVDALSEQVWLD